MTIEPVTLMLIGGAALLILMTQSVISTFGSPRRRLHEDRLGGTSLQPKVPVGTRQRMFADLEESLAAQIPALNSEVAHLDLQLSRSGYYRSGARRSYLAVRNALAILPLLVTAALVVWYAPPAHLALAASGMGLVAAVAGFCLPRLYVHRRGSHRVRRIERGLPDALDMVTMCLGGGMTLHDAMARVSEEIDVAHPDLALELRIILTQAQLGTFQQSLNHFAKRMGSEDVNALTALLNQSERLGTDVVAALREHANTLRLRRRQRADERANRAGVQMLFPLVLCLAPSVFILLLGPAALEIRSFLVTQRRPGGVLSQRNLEELRDDEPTGTTARPARR